MHFDTAMLSKIGGQKVNEDFCDFTMLKDGACWAIADGLGGHKGGEIASRLAVEEVIKQFSSSPEITALTLYKHIEAAQKVLLLKQERERFLSSMRTTIAVLLSDCLEVLWGHVGDTRFYFFRRGEIIVQTKDHSVSQVLSDAGEIAPEQIRFHEDRNRLLRVLGNRDNFKPTIPEKSLPVQGNDAFLLCTDGFWEYIAEREMLSYLAGSSDPDTWLKQMEKRILETAPEGHDNYSAIAVFVK